MSFKIRCSSIHKIIGEPRNKSEVLSETAKGYVIDCLKQDLFGYTAFGGNGCTEKGNLLEDTAVKASGMTRGMAYTKHQGRRENRYISGECDIYDPDNSLIVDTKCSWNIDTHPFFQAEAHAKAVKAGYIWQMYGYMWLYGCERADIDFWLFPTPEQLLKPWERDNPNLLHQYTAMVEQIPLAKRKTTVSLNRSDCDDKGNSYYEQAIAQITAKAAACQELYEKLKAEFI